MACGPADITRLLREIDRGNRAVEPLLAEAVYTELHRLARRCMRPERRDHTLQPTVLVHEAFMRLVGAGPGEWSDRKHFFAVAANIMRRILIDHARQVRAQKRGGGKKMDLTADMAVTDAMSDEMIALDEALTRLAALDLRQARVVELRFFAGISEDEIASILGVSSRTVKRDWITARAWLHNQLRGRGA